MPQSIIPLAMKTCWSCGKEYPDSATTCALDHRPLIAKQLPNHPAPTTETPLIYPDACPLCGEFAGHKPVVNLRESFNWMALLGGGILAVLLLNASRAKRVQCNACGEIFSHREPLSTISLIAFWLLVTPMILLVIAFFAYLLWPSFTEK